MAKQPKRKARPSWFQKQVDQNGPDFLLRKQPSDIQRDALNIVRDIARGNITKRDFNYLFSLKVLSNVRIAIYNKYLESYVYNSCMTFALQVPNSAQILQTHFGIDDSSFQRFYNESKDTIAAYILVLNSIDNMTAAVQREYSSDEERDAFYMQVYSSIQYQVSRYRYKL